MTCQWLLLGKLNLIQDWTEPEDHRRCCSSRALYWAPLKLLFQNVSGLKAEVRSNDKYTEHLPSLSPDMSRIHCLTAHNVLECLSCIAKEQERKYLAFWIPSARGGIPWGIPPWEVNKVYGNRFMQLYSVQKSITCTCFPPFCELIQSNTKDICYMAFMEYEKL